MSDMDIVPRRPKKAPKNPSARPAPNGVHNRASLVEKKEMIEAMEKGLAEGKSYAKVGEELNMTRQLARSIFLRRNHTKHFLKLANNPNNSKIVPKRSYVINLMESSLGSWIEDQALKQVREAGPQIREKARTMIGKIDQQLARTTQFAGSGGWFSNFRRRNGLKWTHPPDTTSNKFTYLQTTNPVTVNRFLNELEKIIVTGQYTTDQVFALDEFGLKWKNLPIDPDNANRVTLAFATNASGDCKLKPILVNTHQSPKSLNNLSRNRLPVNFRWNLNDAKMTADIFLEWFQSEFVPEIETYLTGKNLPFKAILLLDSAPVHPKELETLHPDIKVIFFPPNTLVSLQPINLNLVKTFKCFYILRALELMFNKTDLSNEQAPFDPQNLLEKRDKFTIKSAINLIGQAWDDISPDLIRLGWKKIFIQGIPMLPEDHHLSTSKEEIQNLLQLLCVQEVKLDQFLESEREDAVDYEALNQGQIELLHELEIELKEIEQQEQEYAAMKAIMEVDRELQAEEQANLNPIRRPINPNGNNEDLSNDSEQEPSIDSSELMEVIENDHNYITKAPLTSLDISYPPFSLPTNSPTSDHYDVIDDHDHHDHSHSVNIPSMVQQLVRTSPSSVDHHQHSQHSKCQCECLKQILSLLLNCKCSSFVACAKQCPSSSNSIIETVKPLEPVHIPSKGLKTYSKVNPITTKTVKHIL